MAFRNEMEGHTFTKGPMLDPVGLFYICFVSFYTAVLLGILAWTWYAYKRRAAVRMRGLLFSTITILVIHVYLAAVFIVYPLNSYWRCDTEFWSMNTVFPLGLALFQATNVRLLSYSTQQSNMLQMGGPSGNRAPFKLSYSGLKDWFVGLNLIRQTFLFISIGLAVQLVLTFVLFFGSRRFSPDVGFFGNHVDQLDCRRGFEWIPSVVWQFCWAWIFDPWVLYRTRSVRDTHYWAIQTRVAVIAGLPGTPMWLAFLYIENSNVARVNQWWPPAMWFAPGLITLQVSILVFGGLDVLAEKRRENRAKSVSVSTTSKTSLSTSTTSFRKSQELAYNWDAFEHHLRFGIRPLLSFASTRDFTAESLVFLVQVGLFKTKWRRNIVMAPILGKNVNTKDEIEMFEDAARVFFELISRQFARIPINLDSKTYDILEYMFKNCLYEPRASASRNADTTAQVPDATLHPLKKMNKIPSREVVAPWESPEIPAARPSTPITGVSELDNLDTELAVLTFDDGSDHNLVPTGTKANIGPPVPANTSSLSSFLLDSYGGTITPKYTSFNRNLAYSTTRGYVPMAFNLHVFDRAEEKIKYLLYTNTWKSYVKAMSDFEMSNVVEESNLVAQLENPGYTDIEMQGLNHELQNRIHRGVLDSDDEPATVDNVDSKCSACRKKEERRAYQLIESAGLPADLRFGLGRIDRNLDGGHHASEASSAVDEEHHHEDEHPSEAGVVVGADMLE